MRAGAVVTLLLATAPSRAHAQPLPAEPSTTADGTLHVHIPGTDPLSLEMRVAGDGPWFVLCKTPCDARLSTRAVYRLGGPGYVPSNAFQISAEEGPNVTLEVRPFSERGRRLAIALTVLGPAAMVTGGVMLSRSAEHPVFAEVGIPTAFVGLLALLGGLVALPEKTVVNLRPSEPATTADGPLRWATPREASALEGAYPRMLSTPLFARLFR